jgi:hypothetical protein
MDKFMVKTKEGFGEGIDKSCLKRCGLWILVILHFCIIIS